MDGDVYILKGLYYLGLGFLFDRLGLECPIQVFNLYCWNCQYIASWFLHRHSLIVLILEKAYSQIVHWPILFTLRNIA